MRRCRPSVFYKDENNFRRRLGKWSEARLRVQIEGLVRAGLDMKQTGFPAETLCREALSALLLMAGDGDPSGSRRGERKRH